MARMATITSIAWNASPGQSTVDAQTQASELLRLAALAQPDLVIFPELFLHQDSNVSIARQADTLPNPITDHFGRLARLYRLNIIVPMPVIIEGQIYNSAVIINREGEIVGRYDKRHPTESELAIGIAPGTGTRVFALDFARIAPVICFDLNFMQDAEILQQLDVNLICVHSMFTGGQLLAHWAVTAGAYLISAYQEDSRLIDMTGTELARIGNRYEQFRLWKLQPIMTSRINIDRRLFHIDYNVADYDGVHGGVHRLLAEAAGQVTIDHNLDLGVFALGALEDITLDELTARYGLESRNAYFTRMKG